MYRFYRSDPLLQQLHERFPFVNIWDDHEYSDDCWGATGTYFDGRRDEFDPPRRVNAEKAFFEYVGVDGGADAGGEVDLSSRPLYPNARLYRELRYGGNLHLLLTDYRSFRPDHLIPEDAFPGTVAVDRAALTALLGAQGIPYEAVKANFSPYVDLAAPPAGLEALFAAYRQILTGVLTVAYVQEGLAPAQASAKALGKITGKLDAQVVNALLASYNADPTTSPKVPLLDAAVLATLDRGISFAIMGKTALFSSLGARYFVVRPTFDLYAAYRTLLLQDAAAENAYGDDQRTWLESALQQSDARWKVVTNSTSLTSMILDLTGTSSRPAAACQGRAGATAAATAQPLLSQRGSVRRFPQLPAPPARSLRGSERCGDRLGDIHAAFATGLPAGYGNSRAQRFPRRRCAPVCWPPCSPTRRSRKCPDWRG